MTHVKKASVQIVLCTVTYGVKGYQSANYLC